MLTNSYISHRYSALTANLRLLLFLTLYFAFGLAALSAQSRPAVASTAPKLDQATLVNIIESEDLRRWDGQLERLLNSDSVAIRVRAALAAGRIGDERAVGPLAQLLAQDKHPDVQAMAAFALGEIESDKASESLVTALAVPHTSSIVRASVVEALGKIAATMREKQKDRADLLAQRILAVLEYESGRRARPENDVVLKTLTAVLRSRPANAGVVVAKFLSNAESRVREDAANTLARLRANDGNASLRELLIRDEDPVVRANAARILGATDDKQALALLLERALNDPDQRVRVSSIRALATLKDAQAIAQLLPRVKDLDQNEAIEVVNACAAAFAPTALVRPAAAPAFDGLAHTFKSIETTPEYFSALAKLDPTLALSSIPHIGPDDKPQAELFTDWRFTSAVAQGLGAIAELKTENYGPDLTSAQTRSAALLRRMLSDSRLNSVARPDVLSAYAAFKPGDLAEVLRVQLLDKDVWVRATAAGLLAEVPESQANTQALVDALPIALGDKQMNDAALAILDALGKTKLEASELAQNAIKSSFASHDHLVRRKAAALLKEHGPGDFSDKVGTVNSQFIRRDYVRSAQRKNGTLRAVVKLARGSFVIDLFPEDAPLNVDSFITLAQHGYFNGISFHRVVPNFVVQGGDPRGDGNGGPGYQLRCEINLAPYDRGAVGMALSGKDTGGSQWFVTHSPQPHLDGGYTVIGQVSESAMKVVDKIVRGDKIESIVIVAVPRGQRTRQAN